MKTINPTRFYCGTKGIEMHSQLSLVFKNSITFVNLVTDNAMKSGLYLHQNRNVKRTRELEHMTTYSKLVVSLFGLLDKSTADVEFN